MCMCIGGLELHEILMPVNRAIASYTDTYVNKNTITSLYTHTVNVICDPLDNRATDTIGIHMCDVYIYV